MFSWHAITNLASFSVITPVALVITLWLWLGHAWRLSVWWLGLFTAGMAIVVVSKITFIGWGIGYRDYDFTGFSGHVVRATAIAPVLLYLISQRAAPTLRNLAVVTGYGFAVLIAISRVVVRAHSPSESIMGWVLGAIISAWMIYLLHHTPAIRIRHWLISLLLACLLWLSYLYATPTPTQRWITQVALYLSGHDRPYIRVTWQLAPKSWRGTKPSDTEI
ncbi:MAG: phosphatase PAP2 family protein [Sulfuriferula sp.]|nr:phosphatase PAP2 family protein [Sulfuriferula sp.]